MGRLALCVWRGPDCVQLADKTIGLCPHVVAVAELLGKLQGLLSCVQKIPSLTHLTTTMPRGRDTKVVLLLLHDVRYVQRQRESFLLCKKFLG